MRRGFAVRLDQAGTRSTGGKAADCETYVTEYLRDRIVDLEEQVKRGGGSGSSTSSGRRKGSQELTSSSRGRRPSAPRTTRRR